jgi:hypothetical protein
LKEEETRYKERIEQAILEKDKEIADLKIEMQNLDENHKNN